jgi:hypothetical protein
MRIRLAVTKALKRASRITSLVNKQASPSQISYSRRCYQSDLLKHGIDANHLDLEPCTRGIHRLTNNIEHYGLETQQQHNNNTSIMYHTTLAPGISAAIGSLLLYCPKGKEGWNVLGGSCRNC